MKNIAKITMRAALWILVCIMATGCIFTKMDNGDKMRSVLIQVDVATEGMTKSIAAVTSDEESAINSIRIYAFYNGNLSGHFSREQASSDPIVMDLMLPYSGIHNVDFYVVANEKSIVSTATSPTIGPNTTEEQLKSVCMGSLNTTEGLPLYYNKTVAINVDNLSSEQAPSGHENHWLLAQQLTVDLTRPVSKVAVYAAEVAEGSEVYETTAPKLTITSLQITNTLAAGYLFAGNTTTVANGSDYTDDTHYTISRVIGEQNGTALENSDNYNEIMAPQYFFENSLGGANWSSGYIESTGDLSQIAQGAMALKIGYSFDGGTTSSYAYVKMPQIERNVFYKVLCSFSPVGGHQEFHITINPWNYISHTYDEITVTN